MTDFNSSVVTSSDSGDISYVPPQDIDNTETITMYSRPSGFGPACSAGKVTGTNGYGSRIGFNFPFTPPYYHGQSWCDIKFTPTESRKHSLSEILNSASFTFIRADEYAQVLLTDIGVIDGPQAPHLVNQNAMQISASLIVDGIANKKSDILLSGRSSTRMGITPPSRFDYSAPTDGTPRS